MARKIRNRQKMIKIRAATGPLTCWFSLERVTGIEPALSAWEADVLPLNYTRAVSGPTVQQAPLSSPRHRTGPKRKVGAVGIQDA
jgi:hypothetical protein